MNQRARVRKVGALLALLLAAAAAPAMAAGEGTATSGTTGTSAASSRVAAKAPTARISGSGSSWAGNAVEDWRSAIKAQNVTVDYSNVGSSQGRKDFAQGLADFAVSEIPYTGDTADKQDTVKPNFSYGLLPVVAGGTAFMYNLKVGGKRFTDLRLSQEALAKIFSGQVTQWNDPIIAATNPGVALPGQRITVVVRSDGSGATAQFTLWMLRQFPNDYAALCAKTKCDPKAATSYFPYSGLSNFTAQSGSNGVTTYTSNTEYTINYDEYSYALGVGFPVAKVRNAAGFFTLPTDTGVAVALTQAKINTDQNSDNYLSQDLSAVYPYKDPRTYPLSAYSYMIQPTQTRGNFDNAKGETLAYFEQFVLCEGQKTMGRLGYSPLPMNLVLAALDQVLKVPGIGADTKAKIQQTKSGVASGGANPCNNPTFRPGESPSRNVLIDKAPFPAECDAACQAPWIGKSVSNSTGGAKGAGTKSSGATAATGTDAAAAPAAVDPAAAAAAAAPTACDPDTGLCTGDTTAAAGAADATAVATPINLAGRSAWGPAQLALLITALVIGLLVLGPPLAARALDAGRAGAGRGGAVAAGGAGPISGTAAPTDQAGPPAPPTGPAGGAS